MRRLVLGMVAVLLIAASPATAQHNAVVDQYAGEAVCQAVINIIINNNANNESEQEVTAGDNTASNSSNQQTTTGDNVVNNEANQEVAAESVNEIAQELNVSPTIVQQCAEEGGVSLDGETTDGTTGEDTDGTTDGDTDETLPEGEDEVIQASLKGTPSTLPDTGGLEVWTGGALFLGAGLMMWRMVHRR